MSKKIIFVITIVFFAGMLFLTLFAEGIHNAALPRVTVSRPETRMFEEKLTDTESLHTEKTALPKALCEQGVYVLYTAEKNGTKRELVRLASIQTGAETDDGYVEIVSGLMFTDRIVISSTGELHDGCEVMVE